MLAWGSTVFIFPIFFETSICFWITKKLITFNIFLILVDDNYFAILALNSSLYTNWLSWPQKCLFGLAIEAFKGFISFGTKSTFFWCSHVTFLRSATTEIRPELFHAIFIKKNSKNFGQVWATFLQTNVCIKFFFAHFYCHEKHGFLFECQIYLPRTLNFYNFRKNILSICLCIGRYS